MVRNIIKSRKPRTTLSKKKRGSRKKSGDKHPRVVVSLTTLPYRIGGVAKTLGSILNQTLVPSKIYVNLPTRTSRGDKYVIPANLLKLTKKHPIVKINRCKKDYGPGTKLYPTLRHEKGPNTRIITIDDDGIYPKKTIQYLVETSLKKPNSALAYSAWNINLKHFGIEDYSYLGGNYTDTYDSDWNWGRECAPGNMDIIEGWGGALYIRSFFMDGKKDQSKEFINFMEKGPAECFFVDDVWISAWLAKKRIHIYVVEKAYMPIHTTDTLENTLHGNSDVTNRNRICTKFYKKYFKKMGYQTDNCKKRLKRRIEIVDDY